MTATAAPHAAIAPKTPLLPEAKPETLGLSRPRLPAMSDAFKREIDKGTLPGVTVLVASFPLVCHPGDAFNYSRSTDILGRIIEIVSGKSLGAFLTERVLAPLQMAETGFSAAEANAGRLAEPFAADPWTGDKVALFNMLEQPIMESGGGGLVSTTMDYARIALMLRNGGTLDGNRIIGRKTLELMASDHLGPNVVTNGTLLSPGHGFGLGFAVRREAGIAPFPGSVGQFFWSGIAGTFFWID